MRWGRRTLQGRPISLRSGEPERTIGNQHKTVIRRGYRGPIGILDRRREVDARKALQANFDGLAKLLAMLN